jgi:hypothetical protein
MENQALLQLLEITPHWLVVVARTMFRQLVTPVVLVEEAQVRAAELLAVHLNQPSGGSLRHM